MKSPKILICIACAMGLALTLVNVGLAQKPQGKITITDTGIIIHPGTKLSAADEKRLNEALKHYNESLYKIEKYDKGNVKEAKGKLSDVHVDDQLKSEIAKAKADGTSDSTDQFVVVDNKLNVPPPPPPKGTERDKTAAKKLLARIRPVLEKYNK